jgi:hypothetical protein
MRVEFTCGRCFRVLAEAYPRGRGPTGVMEVGVGRWGLFLLQDWNGPNLLPASGMHFRQVIDCHPRRCGAHFVLRPERLARRLDEAAHGGRVVLL